MLVPPGTFGKVDPGGDVLSDYLKQLEAQQEMVREMIANQRLLLKSGKVATAGTNPGKLQSATGKMVRGFICDRACACNAFDANE